MKSLILLGCLFVAAVAPAQKFISETSNVKFFSKATIEDISATNVKSMCLFNTASGEIAFVIPIREFQFEKSLMQEHFNEKYLETEKFPKSTFQGKLIGYVPDAKGSQEVRAQGKLTIHGVTRDVDIPGTADFDSHRVAFVSKFLVRLEDYSIPRPQVLWQNIAEAVEVSIDFILKPYEK